MNRINKISLCCYEIQGNQDHEEQQRRMYIKSQNHTNLFQDQTSVPMLTMGTNSNIKFSKISTKNDQPIYELLLRLYDNRTQKQTYFSDRIFNILSKKRINPNFNWVEDSQGQRDDLEYYIPQLITYLVIEQNLDNVNLIKMILDACTTDFYFAHSVYFYLNSFTQNWMNEPIKGVMDFIEKQFLPTMQIYSKNRLSGIQFTKGMIIHHDPHFKQLTVDQEPAEQQQCKNQSENFKVYGTKEYADPPPDFPKTISHKKIIKKQYNEEGFMETPSFWADLISIGQDISSVQASERNQLLEHMIKTRVNPKLPASVYIPFFKEKIRMYTVLCVWKGRLFSTKERAPYSIWVQMYRQEQELEIIQQALEKQLPPMKNQSKDKKQKILNKIYETLSKPFNIADNRNTLNIKKFIKNKFRSKQEEVEQQKEQKIKTRKKTRTIDFKDRPCISQSFYESNQRKFSNDYDRGPHALSFIYNNSDGSSGQQNQNFSQISGSSQRDKDIFDAHVYNNDQQKQEQYFPTKSTVKIEQFRKRSIYRDLKSWKLVNLMVKTGDDLKQEQFAMQLINNFDGIFRKEKIGCAVFPYQVISLGPNYGLIEMLQDVTTLDGLFKILGPKKQTLKEFFDQFYAQNKAEAKKNFMRSLAGYCLITYFLQVKDRHNGNILLHRDGYIIHIDFGFFLSSAPGKGVELQKKVPFKLLSQYVQVIGSLSSESFFEFRRLFYKGFEAIVKHRSSILSLVKMMYSSHGESMGCFIKSQQAMNALQRRLNPPENLEQFCYNLINSSLDNWRSKWYDKFQYFLQKIYY